MDALQFPSFAQTCENQILSGQRVPLNASTSHAIAIGMFYVQITISLTLPKSDYIEQLFYITEAFL